MTNTPAFLLIGDGRLARHLAEYSRLLKIEVARWSRRAIEDPRPQLRTATHVFLAISDDGIGRFFDQWKSVASQKTRWVHFSGARTFPGISGAHPLMTFGPELYDLAAYLKIPFILEANGPSLSSILPGFPNPSYQIPVQKKALYHAWAVLAANSVSGTWREYRRLAGEEFDLPETALHPFLKKTAENALHLENPLTGPIARGDLATIESNLRALEGSDFQQLYQALAAIFGKERI